MKTRGKRRLTKSSLVHFVIGNSNIIGVVGRFLVAALLLLVISSVQQPVKLVKNQQAEFSHISNNYSIDVDETCTAIPIIRPSGSYFLDQAIQAGLSAEGISPSFSVGSYYANKVPFHMATDTANFHLIKELLQENKDIILYSSTKSFEGSSSGSSAKVTIPSFDIGANQGFYTYYLASLGLDVHSFEINESNFKCLQHGAEFNPKIVSDRVHLYPIGLGDKNARFGMQGNNYEGFLKAGMKGPILGVTFDCFAEHMKDTLADLSNVFFVKIDVEGFEIAVLIGAQKSLFREDHQVNIKGMIIEVGPDRWGRASVDLVTGIEEIKRVSAHFKNSYVLIRTEGGYAKNCPDSLAGPLSDKQPRAIVGGTKMYAVKYSEWDALLKDMEEKHYDCNFWFKN